MNCDNELLEYLYENVGMGIHSLNKLIDALECKENKIRKVLSDELIEFEKYKKKINSSSKKFGIKLNAPGMMEKLTSSMSISNEVKSDNSDAKIAHMLIEGFTMASVDIATKIKNYEKDTNKALIKLAKEYYKYLEEEIEKLKSYL